MYRMPPKTPAQYWTVLQASKADPEQPSLASILDAFDPAAGTVDVCVVGCGPAGLALAAELGANGISVALIGAYLYPLLMQSSPQNIVI